MPLQHFKVLSFDVVGTLLDLERAAGDATWYPDDLEREWHAVGPALGLPDNLHVAQSQYHGIGVATRQGPATAWIERRHGMKGSGGTQRYGMGRRSPAGRVVMSACASSIGSDAAPSARACSNRSSPSLRASVSRRACSARRRADSSGAWCDARTAAAHPSRRAAWSG